MEENKIKDAEITPEVKMDDSTEENSINSFSLYDEIGRDELERKNKTDFQKKMLLLFVLGFLIGIALKTEALKKITIGFNDYQMKAVRQDYDLNRLQVEISKQAEEDAKKEIQSENGQVQTGEDGARAIDEKQSDEAAE